MKNTSLLHSSNMPLPVLILILIFTPVFSQVPVNVLSSPPFAEVVVDDSLVGKTPLRRLDLSVGYHSINLVLSDHVPIFYELDLQDAAALELRFQLKRLCRVVFKSKEEDLHFRLDGKYEWSSSAMKFTMEEGKHHLEVFDEEELIDEQMLDVLQSSEFIYQLE
ncbi:MAG: PEGA domain-containing protein [Candidatus Marinimicrobia bacterium]|nr:PEGA domain-containing protein [Candidatus Neomarinimicrobiota bacterium]